jgi:Tfp pilus assembly protein FimT
LFDLSFESNPFERRRHASICRDGYAINRIQFGDHGVTRDWNLTVAMARSTLSGGQKVTGPGAAPGVAILVPWRGWLRICSPADTLTAPSTLGRWQ